MIRNNGPLLWSNARRPFPRSWWIGVGTLTVTCDHSGCSATVTATGSDCNGPVIESIYLPPGSEWTLGERDLCPDHTIRPAPEIMCLGPWMPYPDTDADGMARRVENGDDIGDLGLRLHKSGWYAATGHLVATGEETGQQGQDAADTWARAQGWALRDAKVTP